MVILSESCSIFRNITLNVGLQSVPSKHSFNILTQPITLLFVSETMQISVKQFKIHFKHISFKLFEELKKDENGKT